MPGCFKSFWQNFQISNSNGNSPDFQLTLGCFTGPLEDIPKRDLQVTGLICKEKFARFSENPDKFSDKFVRLGLAFSLTQQASGLFWPTAAPRIKRRIYWKRPGKSQMAYWPSIHTTNLIRWGSRVQRGAQVCNPRTWPIIQLWQSCKAARMRHYITCLSEGTKRCAKACKLL